MTTVTDGSALDPRPAITGPGEPIDLASGGDRARAGGRDRRQMWAIRLAVPVVVLAIWVVASWTSDLVPGVAVTFETLGDQLSSGDLTPHLQSTAHASLVGFALAAVTGMPLGFLLGRSPYWYKVSEPMVAAGYAVPRIIIYPILLSIFGVTLDAKIGVAAISAFFPVVFTSMAGSREVSAVLVKLGRSLDMSRRQLFFKILLPAAAPTVMFGMRIGFSIGFIGVILAEMFAAKEGLGTVVTEAYGLLRIPEMYAVIVLISVFAFAVNLALWTCERRLRHTTS